MRPWTAGRGECGPRPRAWPRPRRAPPSRLGLRGPGCARGRAIGGRAPRGLRACPLQGRPRVCPGLPRPRPLRQRFPGQRRLQPGPPPPPGRSGEPRRVGSEGRGGGVLPASFLSLSLSFNPETYLVKNSSFLSSPSFLTSLWKLQ